MKLSERQLRALVSQVIGEAKVVPDDAVQQVQDAVKVLIKFGPALVSHFDDLSRQFQAFEDYAAADIVRRMDNVSFVLDKLPMDLEELDDLVDVFNAAKKLASHMGKKSF